MLKSLDWTTVILYLIMVVAGWFTINSACYHLDNASMFDFSRPTGKQAVWFACSCVLIFLLMFIDAKTYRYWTPVMYIAMMFVLFATRFVAQEVKGSLSWIDFGVFRIQPAEFGKFITALMLAWMFDQYGFKLGSWSSYLKVLSIIFLPVGLILFQNETGSALVYFSFFLLLYRQGLPGIFLWAGFSFVLIFVLGLIYGENIVLFLIPILIALMFVGYAKNWQAAKLTLTVAIVAYVVYFAVKYFVTIPEPVLPYYRFRWVGLAVSVWCGLYALWIWISRRALSYSLLALFAFGFITFQYSVDYAFNNLLQEHQRKRIEVLLGLEEDLKGAGYNVNQAKIAIGSGGFWGKGYMEGTQTHLEYIPEQHTDFIFCTVGEEKGFFGATLLLLLYTVLIVRIIMLAERQSTIFAQVYAYCVASIFFFHVAINIGMVIGLAPVIGIPLPFFSYGGSSLWSFTILLWILLKLDASRNARY